MSPVINLANLPQFLAVNLTADGGYDKGDRVIPNCVQIVTSWGLVNGKIAHNVLHASYQGSFVGNQQIADQILASLTSGAQWTALAPFLSNLGNLYGVSIRNLGVKDQPIIESLPGGANGAGGGPTLPDEVAAVLTLRTQNVGRQNRGRMFIPNWDATAIGTGGTMSPAAVTALGNWGSIIAGTLLVHNWVLGIGHFHRLEYTSANGTHHEERPAGVVPVTSVEVRDNHWDTMRRRGLK